MKEKIKNLLIVSKTKYGTFNLKRFNKTIKQLSKTK